MGGGGVEDQWVGVQLNAGGESSRVESDKRTLWDLGPALYSGGVFLRPFLSFDILSVLVFSNVMTL